MTGSIAGNLLTNVESLALRVGETVQNQTTTIAYGNIGESQVYVALL